MQQEVTNVSGEDWRPFFDTMVSGDDVPQRKPWSDLLTSAMQNLGVIAAKEANVTAIFCNGAGWDQHR